MFNTYVNVLRDLAFILEIIAAIVSAPYFIKSKDIKIRYFIIFIWVTAVIECLGWAFRFFLKAENTSVLFNLYTFFNVIFIFYFYHLLVLDKTRRFWIKCFGFVFIISLVIFGFYENYITQLMAMPYVIASSLLIIVIIFFYIEILSTKEVLNIKKNIFFWISTGLLLYNAGGIPFNLFINYYARGQYLNQLFSINYILVIILNSCFIIGFLWSNKK